MDAVAYILQKYGLNPARVIEIPDVGRNDLALLFNELGFRAGAEVGVQYGQFSKVLCRGNPGVKHYCIDSYQPYKGYTDRGFDGHYDEFREGAHARLDRYGCIFIEKFSMDAVADFEDNSLDYVYIDGNHKFRYVAEDVCEWTARVRPGGVVSGHDYFKGNRNNEQYQVMEVVNAYVSAFRLWPLFILGRKIPLAPGEVRDRPRSWMFIKR